MELTAELLAQLVALACLLVALPCAWAMRPVDDPEDEDPPACQCDPFLAAMTAAEDRLSDGLSAMRAEIARLAAIGRRFEKLPACAVQRAAQDTGATPKRQPERPKKR